MKNLETTASAYKLSFAQNARKSVVGAAYRVGASFALDAVYLTTLGVVKHYLGDYESARQATDTANELLNNFNTWKFLRVTAWVVGINYADYRWDITNRLDRTAEKMQNGLKSAVKSLRR